MGEAKMTLAICLRCGAEKVGAFTSCLRCGFTPETSEDQAKSIMLSDHNVAAAELKQVSQQIQAGQQPTFNEADLKEMSDEISSMDIGAMDTDIRRTFNGCFFIVTAVVIGIIVLSWLFFRW